MYTEIFTQYKNIDLNIIKSLKDDKEDITLLDDREYIIKKIVSLKLDKDTFLKYYKDMELDNLDVEIENLLKEKLQNVQQEIRKLKMAGQANKGYAASNRQENFFSKKV